MIRTIWAQYPTIFVRDVLKELDSFNVIDLGCGTGGIDIELALSGFNVKAIDSHKDSINIAEYKKNNLFLPKENFIEKVLEKVDYSEKPEEDFMTSRYSEETCYPIAGDKEDNEVYLDSLPINKELSNLEFICSDLTEINLDFSDFDSILMLCLLNHITETKTNNILESIVKRLPTGGNLIIGYPSFYKSMTADQENYGLNFSLSGSGYGVNFSDIVKEFGLEENKELEKDFMRKVFDSVCKLQGYDPYAIEAKFICYILRKKYHPEISLTETVKKVVHGKR